MTKPVDLLTVADLTKTYGRLAAVNRLSFSVKSGEILGVSGPNGAGKTTMFDLISGVTPMTEGKVTFDGVNIQGCSPDEICHAGIARTFQLNATFSGLSLFQSVLVGSSFGRRNPGLGIFTGINRNAQKQAQEAIEFVGLGDRAGLLLGNATVFEAKLSMIAGALATTPKMLLLDEPVGGLVPKEADKVAELIKRIRERGITIVMVEHVMRILTALSDRILMMHHGARLFEGTPDQMLKDQLVREIYLGREMADA